MTKKQTPIDLQWWERRGTMVYGEEENGPGSAPFIRELPSVDEAQRLVDAHNASLPG